MAGTSNQYNAPRFAGRNSHVESWFLRLNDPNSPRALWLKATVLNQDDGTKSAEAWCSAFDAVDTLAIRETVPLAESPITMDDEALSAEVGGLNLRLREHGGSTKGALVGDAGEIGWDLEMTRVPGPLGEPLSLLPSDRLIDAPFPKSKLLTPFPASTFRGEVRWRDKIWKVSDWVGMQGHNWGAAHSPEYAWGQCVFLDAADEPFAMVEGASGRIELGPVNSPLLSMMTVRRKGREYRFDKLVDLWRQTPNIDFPEWTLSMSSSAGKATLSMRADPDQMVCLGYDNPDAVRRFCLNSKMATVTLRVDPNNEDGFVCSSPHGGALEFLQQVETSAVQPVV